VLDWRCCGRWKLSLRMLIVLLVPLLLLLAFGAV
jgi:hypothetical protein